MQHPTLSNYIRLAIPLAAALVAAAAVVSPRADGSIIVAIATARRNLGSVMCRCDRASRLA